MAAFTTKAPGDWTDPITWYTGPPVASSTQPAEGSFEAPDISSNSSQFNPGGSAWTFNARSGIIDPPSAYGAPSATAGSQIGFIQNEGGTAGQISQSFSWAAGRYWVAIKVAQRSGTNNPIEVKIDGVSVGVISPASTSFVQHVVGPFNVTSGSHTLTLLGIGNAASDHTSFIDEVLLADDLTLSESYIPTDGDTVAVFHDPVSVNANTAIGASPSSDPGSWVDADLYISPAGGVVVKSGFTLTVKGHLSADNGASSAAGTITLESGAVMEFDNSGMSGHRPKVVLGFSNNPAAPCLVIANGTAGSRCEIRTVGGGLNATFTTSTAQEGCGIQLACCDVNDVGDASVPAFETRSVSLLIDRCVFNGCGKTYWQTGAAGDISILDSTWKNTLEDRCIECGSSLSNAAHPGDDWLIDGCSFDKVCHLPLNRLVTTNTVFMAGWAGAGSDRIQATFTDCFIRWGNVDPVDRGGNWDGNAMVVDGCTLDLTDGTYSATANVSNPHWTTPGGGVSVTDTLFEDFGSTDDGDVDYGPNGAGAQSAFLRVLGISQVGTNPGTMSTFNGGAGASATYDHCTWQTAQNGPVALGEAPGAEAGMLASYRSNIFFRKSGSATGIYKLGNYQGAGLVTDVGDAADLDYNCGFGITVTGGLGTNGYNVPLTGTPGANDVDVDPEFVDWDRNFSTWVESLEGPTLPGNGSPTRQDYNAYGLWKLYLSNDSADPDYDASYTLAAYLTYVRAGFAPQNAALQNAGHDSVTIGAVEFAAPASGNRRRRVLLTRAG